MMANYEQWVESLEEQGIDVDGLIGMRDEIVKDRIAKTYLANEELDGKTIRIPGYLLPLEFDGDRVVSFSLYPMLAPVFTRHLRPRTRSCTLKPMRVTPPMAACIPRSGSTACSKMSAAN